MILFKTSLTTGKLPRTWKDASISAIHKKGSKQRAWNYRPVSLTSIVCKILESFIREAIVDYMKENLLFSDKQFGFIGGRSTSLQLLIPPLYRGCELCASLVRPQNWPGRRWGQKGGRTFAVVVQGWHIGRSDIAMDAMVAVKFWACSKQSHKGRRGGRSLTGRSKEAGWRHTHRRDRRMDAQWSAIGRPEKNANIVYQFERHVCLPCTTSVPPLADQWRPFGDHCGDHYASIQRPRQHLSHHGNGSAFTLPSLRDLLCSSFGRSRKAQGSCCSSYTETELSGLRRPLSVLTIFMVAQRWHEGRSPVQRGL